MFPYESIGYAFKSLISDCLINGREISPRGIKTKELISPRIEIINPRRRWLISNIRKVNPIYGIGELLWYLSGTNLLSPIAYYAPSIEQFSDDGKTLNSAYGYRIYNTWYDQWVNTVQHLKQQPDSRQAVIFIRGPEDSLLNTKDSICTNTLQFFIRDNKLIMITNMRSNDLMVGFIYDVFCFTMLQEIMAIELDVELGSYIHIPASLHIYEKWYLKAEEIRADVEDFDLGRMTFSDVNTQKEIKHLITLEEKIRLSDTALIPAMYYLINNNTEYWKNIFCLLLMYKMKTVDIFLPAVTAKIYNFLKKQQNDYFLKYAKAMEE